MNIILIHGGANTPVKYNGKLESIVSSVNPELSALDAVVQAVVLMENDIQFNAGTGSVPRIDGSIQMDAAVMVPGKFGSVIAIERVMNPVLVARDVMEKSPHIMLAGDGSVKFARKMGYRDYDPYTEKAKKILEQFWGKLDHEDDYTYFKKFSHDTVGAVSYINGQFAAAVSTGGSFPMLRGRVGDSPIIGAGIYAGEQGAVVATGIGEEIALRLLSYRIYAKIGNGDLQDIVASEISKFEVAVGVIAVSDHEYVATSNTEMAYALKKLS